MKATFLRPRTLWFALPLLSCTTDLRAPDAFPETGATTAPDDSGAVLVIDCGTVPPAAIDADYAHTITASGGDGNYLFTATQLPDWLTLQAGTGVLRGVPDEEGAFDVDFAVMDGLGAMGVATCTFDVRPRLDVDLFQEPSRVMPCLEVGEDPNDFIVPNTGNGDPLTCTTLDGRGDGTIPPGISVDPDSCEIEGTVDAGERHGVWAFVVELEQAGVTTHLPYCARKMAPLGTYDITVHHGGDTTNDRSLMPATATFPASGAFTFGGGGDPAFTVGPCGGFNPCFFGYSFVHDASAFATDTFTLEPSQLEMDGGGNPVGFSHEMSAMGPYDAAEFPMLFSDRPFVLNIDIDYCLGAAQADCDETNVATNGDGSLHFSVIMTPAP